jgi:formate dehydrogenase subunit delta
VDITRLVAMANDIAAFFDAETDRAVAVEGVRAHLVRYWDPRMRREIRAHVQSGGTGLCDSASAAVRLLADSPNQSN